LSSEKEVKLLLITASELSAGIQTAFCTMKYKLTVGEKALTLWDAAGLLANDNYSTPTVNNIYCSSSCTGIQW
jgi:hypothetical protein